MDTRSPGSETGQGWMGQVEEANYGPLSPSELPVCTQCRPSSFSIQTRARESPSPRLS